MTTNIDLTNRALAQIGTRSRITAFDDGSAEGLYAGLLYGGLRDFLLREGDYEFATQAIGPVLVQPPFAPWYYTYALPVDCVRVRQVVALDYNEMDPKPVEFNIVHHPYSTPPQKVVAMRVQMGLLVYVASAVPETVWDSMFTEAFVRMLASSLVFALENGAAMSQAKLQEAINFAGLASLKDG